MKASRQTSFWSTLCATVLLCAGPLAAAIWPLGLDRVPGFMDTVTQFYPMRLHAAHMLWSGELPLWNRTCFAGVPFLANPQ